MDVLYQKQAIRTLNRQYGKIHARLRSSTNMDLNHAAFMVHKEGGEFANVIYDHLYYGKPLSREKLINEMGDVLYGLAIACEAIGTTFDYVANRNIVKLSERYQDGEFSEKEAQRKRSE